MKLNIILHRKISLLPTSLLLCVAPFMRRSAYSLADYTLISFWWSQVCHHQSADMPHAQAMCWSVVCIGRRGRAELQTVLISYASHVASSTNRRYLIEILITVGTHRHTHCGIAWPELWSSLHFLRTCCVWEPCLLSLVVSYALLLWLRTIKMPNSASASASTRCEYPHGQPVLPLELQFMCLPL